VCGARRTFTLLHNPGWNFNSPTDLAAPPIVVRPWLVRQSFRAVGPGDYREAL